MAGRDFIVGLDEIVGSDDDYTGADYDELYEHAGADPAPLALPPPQPPPHQHQHRGRVYQRGMPAAYPQQQRGARVVRREPNNSRQFPIGFSAEIPLNGEADIEVKPQVLFRGERLAVAPSCAPFFDIIDIKVGKDSQLAAVGDLTAESLSALAVGVRMELDTASPGITITLRVRNTGNPLFPEPRSGLHFKAILYGTVLE